MVQWPRLLPRGADYDAPVSSMDILPTAVAAARQRAGVAAPAAESPADGVDLLPYLTGEATGRPHTTLFWRRGVVASVRDGDWKLIRVDGEPSWLFDLAADPYCETSVINQHPDRATELQQKLVAWLKEIDAPAEALAPWT